MQLPRFTLLESGSLLVSPAHLADAGTYTCLATNSRGMDEASADLVVWGKAPASAPVSPSSTTARLCLPPCPRARCGMDPAQLRGWQALPPAMRGAGRSSPGMPRMGSGMWLVVWMGANVGCPLPMPPPAALRAVPVPHPVPSQQGHASPTRRRTRASSRGPRPS